MDFFECFESDIDIVIFNQGETIPWEGENITVYPGRGGFENLKSVFRSYNFASVFYFSNDLNGEKNLKEEEGKLSAILSLCRDSFVRQFFYICGNDDKEGQTVESANRCFRKAACDSMCRELGRKSNVNVCQIKIPYLYSISRQSVLKNWIYELSKGNEVTLPGDSGEITDFISDADLGRLINRMIDFGQNEDYRSFYVYGSSWISWEDVYKSLSKLDGVDPANIHFNKAKEVCPVYRADENLAKEYSWSPTRIFSDDLHKIQEKLKEELEKKKNEKGSLLSRLKIGDRTRVAVEIITVMAAGEALNKLVADNVLLNFLDFRLLAVVIMGTVNGLYAGIITAVIACILYLYDSLQFSSLNLIFFYIQNWIPFSTYILLGSVCGYTTNKRRDSIKNHESVYSILEGKYKFLSSLYGEVLKGKDEFNSQIIGYKDSYGRIYRSVERLNSLLPDKILLEAVNCLEDLL